MKSHLLNTNWINLKNIIMSKKQVEKAVYRYINVKIMKLFCHVCIHMY